MEGSLHARQEILSSNCLSVPNVGYKVWERPIRHYKLEEGNVKEQLREVQNSGKMYDLAEAEACVTRTR